MAIKVNELYLAESEDDQYRLEHDTPELRIRIDQCRVYPAKVARDILIRFPKEHTQ